MTTPLVYIVLVNYKNWQDTAECLESLFKLVYINFKIIVVDNDSQNGSINNLANWAEGKVSAPVNKQFYAAVPVKAEPVVKPLPYQLLHSESMLKASFEDANLLLVQSTVNLGFAGGNNIGISMALANDADFVWLLNNDTVVEQETLTRLVEHFNQSKNKSQRLGILGSKLLYYHAPSLIQAVLGRYHPLMASTSHIGLNSPSSTSFDDLAIGNDDYIVGASMFASTDFIKDIGLMSEEYFLYFEEIDWVKRGRAKGYNIDICLESIIYHKEGAAIGGGTKSNNNKSELSDYYSIRNRLVITRKFYPQYKLPVYLSLTGVALNRVRRKQFSRIPLILAAFKSSFKNLH